MSGVHSLTVLADEPGRDPLEAAFLRAIAEDPDDDATRAAYADWLEEEGKEKQALYLRLDLEWSRTHRSEERFRELGGELAALEFVLDGRWYLGLKRSGRILNCGSADPRDLRTRFAFRCPNRWNDLKGPAEASVRFCGDCRRNVFLCRSIKEAEQHARKGDCIAINSRVALNVIAEEEDAYFNDDRIVMGEYHPEYESAYETESEAPPVAPVALTSAESRWAERIFPKPKKPWWQFW